MSNETTQQILEEGAKAQDKVSGFYFGALEKLKDDAEMDAGERSRQAWAAHEAGKQLLRQAVEDRNEQLEKREASLKRKLFAPASPGEQEAYQQAVREALGNVFQLDGLLSVAQKTGDKNLARAAFAVADEAGEELVVSEYLNHNPDARELYNEYKSIPSAEERESAAETVGDALVPPTASMVRPTQEALDRAQAARQYRPLAG